ncbi:uncharacterized protein LOC111873434 [Cryptotermes secundus]|uniref:uncharacterized protein LOC111873434 n=1 Tax=Cryptotermes secundus TaxID=105785 RepID=UPI000CD7AF8A|nr:uncharacterized protein LOC111873434 [Cryptotermes secundus]
MAFKEDLQASVAELVYGEPLRVPGVLLTPTTEPADPAQLITELRQHMARLRPIPASRHASPATFVHRDLGNCTQFFLRQDAGRRALEPHYRGPYQVFTRRGKTMQILVRDRPVTVSTDRVKPAYMLNESSHETHTTFNPTTTAARASSPNTFKTLRTSYALRTSNPPPCSLQQLSRDLRGGA